MGERDAPRFLICVRGIGDGERNVEVCPGEEQAPAMKQVLGIRNETERMKVTPPLAVAPLAQEYDMRWNPNDDGINMYP